MMGWWDGECMGLRWPGFAWGWVVGVGRKNVGSGKVAWCRVSGRGGGMGFGWQWGGSGGEQGGLGDGMGVSRGGFGNAWGLGRWRG